MSEREKQAIREHLLKVWAEDDFSWRFAASQDRSKSPSFQQFKHNELTKELADEVDRNC